MVFDFVPYQTVFIGACINLLLLLLWLGWYSWRHRRNLKAVPVRVHVSGSRGKTTTTRLIGAALRQAGYRVLTKTTGTEPLLILPDGTEQPWRRLGPATVSEQTRLFRLAARLRADAVVLEAMAIAPEYLWASERYLVWATHLAVTNVRPDHAEVLGDEPDAMARALSVLIARQQQVFLTQEAAAPALLDRIQACQSSVQIVPVADAAPLESNQRLALAVCLALGVAPEVAQQGFAQAGSDPGGFQAKTVRLDGREFQFLDAFSCNDAVSLRQLWRLYAQDPQPTIFFNPRADRPDRTQEFLQLLPQLHENALIVYYGRRLPRWLSLPALARQQIICLAPQRRPEAILQKIAQHAPGSEIWGVGNYAGIGRKISACLREGRQPC